PFSFFQLLPPHPTSTLFPYTTLFRSIVVTTWAWGTEKQYLHDLIASDRRNPTVNANGPLYGSPEYSTDSYPILDPKTNTVSFFRSEEHTSELQSRFDLVCRLLLEKKK